MRYSRALLLALSIGACGETASNPESGGAGLSTTIDSTADTTFAHAEGPVAEAALRHLVEEVRIAPSATDTSLFTEIFEFDVAPSGRILVYDRPTNSALLFGADGRLERRIGRQGAGPGEFNSNNGMVALGDTGWAIWDASNARITYLTADGVSNNSSSTPAGFSTSNGLIIDRKGDLFLRRPVTAPREGEILGRMGLVRVNAAGQLSDSLAPPDLDVQRDVYIAEINTKGNQGRSSSSARHGAGYHWGWHPEGYFVVAHGGLYRIILNAPGRKPLVISRFGPAVPVGEDERSEEKEILTFNLRRTDPAWSWRGPPLPETKAPFTGLTLPRDGRIWARVPLPSERIPDDEITPPRDPKQPINHFRTPVAYEVFSVEGRFLGRVLLPAQTTLMEADGNLVWAITRDENDLPAVVRYRVEPGF